MNVVVQSENVAALRSRGGAQKMKEIRRCNICHNEYQAKNVDKHMHSRAHHGAIARLEGRFHVHKCWACDLVIAGLKLYESHIATHKHMTNLSILEQRRCSEGKTFTLDYNDDKLNALCAKRDQQRLKRKRAKWRRYRVKRAHKNLNRQLQNNIWFVFAHTPESGVTNLKPPPWSDCQNPVTQNVEYPFEYNHEQGHQSSSWIQQSGGWNCVSQDSGACYLKGNTDFTNEQFSEFDIFPTWKNNSKTISDGQGGSDLVNKDCLCCTDGISTKVVMPTHGSCSSSNAEPKSQLASSDKAASTLNSSRLVRSHTNHLSVVLTNICNSQNEGMEREVKRSKGVNNSNKKSNVKQTTISHLSKLNPQKRSPGYSPVPVRKVKEKRHLISVNELPTSSVGALNQTSKEPEKRLEPSQSKSLLPALLSRSVSKTDANKPNLKVARGIRTSQNPPNKSTKSRVLKPELQKLISFKSAQWRVNWKEIYLEATNRKLQREKGLPRFGIDFVNPLPPEPQEPEIEEIEDVVLSEGFQSESIQSDIVNVPFSEVPSTKDACGSQSENSFLFTASGSESRDGGTSRANHALLTMETLPKTSGEMEREKLNKGVSSTVLNTKETHKAEWEKSSSAFKTQRNRLISGNSLVCEEAEQLGDDCLQQLQNMADPNRMECSPVRKRAQEIPLVSDDGILYQYCAERQCSSQVTDLLTMSLREEELNSSLMGVNRQLIQAEVALQTAFMEVQRVQSFKEQVNAEMAILRAKRIEILQSIQNSIHYDTSSVAPPSPASLTDQRKPKTLRPQQEASLNHRTESAGDPEQCTRFTETHELWELTDLSIQSILHSLATTTVPVHHDPACSVLINADPGLEPVECSPDIQNKAQHNTSLPMHAGSQSADLVPSDAGCDAGLPGPAVMSASACKMNCVCCNDDLHLQ